MLYINKFADFHIHTSADKIPDDFKVLKEIHDDQTEYVNILGIDYVEHDCDNTLRALYLKEKFKEMNVSVFGSLRYDRYKNFYNTPFLKQAEDLLNMGCDGIKLIEEKPNYRNFVGFGLNSCLYDDMFNMLEEKQVPIIAHINDPEYFWDKNIMPQVYIDRGWCYDSPEFMSFDEILNEVLERLEKNPNLNIIFAHCMYLDARLEFLTELFEKYPNLSIDMTPGTMYLEFSKRIADWRAFIEKYAHRIYFGTDLGRYPVQFTHKEAVLKMLTGDESEIPVPHHPEEERMRGLDICEEAQKKIFWENHVNMLEGKIKPVNKEMLLKAVKELYEGAKEANDSKVMLERLEIMINDLQSGN